MDQAHINHFEELLKTQKANLETEIKKLETPPAFENVPGEDDEVDESTEYFNATAAAGTLRGECARIEHALLKIKHGGYGICEATGKEIPLEALEENPTLQYHPDYLKEQHQ